MRKKTEKANTMRKSKTKELIRESQTTFIQKASKVHGLTYEVIPTCLKFRVWLQKTILWNFVIRLFIECSLLLSFCCLLTIRYGEYDGLGSWINQISVYIFMIGLLIMPFFIFFFYLKNFDLMNSEDE